MTAPHIPLASLARLQRPQGILQTLRKLLYDSRAPPGRLSKVCQCRRGAPPHIQFFGELEIERGLRLALRRGFHLVVAQILNQFLDGFGTWFSCAIRIFAAAKDWNISLAASVMVGDRWRDIESGKRAGCKTVFIDRGYAERRPESQDYTVASLPDAVPWILKNLTMNERTIS